MRVRPVSVSAWHRCDTDCLLCNCRLQAHQAAGARAELQRAVSRAQNAERARLFLALYWWQDECCSACPHRHCSTRLSICRCLHHRWLYVTCAQPFGARGPWFGPGGHASVLFGALPAPPAPIGAHRLQNVRGPWGCRASCSLEPVGPNCPLARASESRAFGGVRIHVVVISSSK